MLGSDEVAAVTTSLVAIGDALLDRDVVGRVERVAPEAPIPVVDVDAERIRPGGAALAASLARRFAEVTLITALGGNDAGALLRQALDAAGVDVIDTGVAGETPEKIRVRSDGVPIVRLDRGQGVSLGALPPAAEDAVRAADAVLVSDYGKGLTAAADVRALVARACRELPVVWDPHPNGATPPAGLLVVTPNIVELLRAKRETKRDAAPTLAAITTSARALAASAGVQAVAVTMGERGALLVDGDDPPLVVPAPRTAMSDACGAGDSFAAALTAALAHGAVLSEAVEVAVRAATEFVAAGGAAAFAEAIAPTKHHDMLMPRSNTTSAAVVMEWARSRGGTTIATGGCFDLLHAGHVAMLRAARELGDCLVVLLNSDASVTRLKGRDRPLQTAADRAAVLCALDCVDAVEIFDDDTPVEALRRLRPDIYAKGGDYAIGELPEARVVAEWGGQSVLLPYLAGRSTTQLLEEAARHADR